MKNILFLFVFIIVVGCENEKGTEPGPKTLAAADLYWVSSSDGELYEQGDWMGNAQFVYQDGVTTLEVSVSGMEPNTAHAMHLHQGTLEEPGRHWNQGKFVAFCEVESMGRLWLKPFAGDVGNIQVNDDGNGYYTLSTDLWTLGTKDDADVSGTILFIHHKSQDFASECDPNHTHEPSAHMNAKIAGGTVILNAELLR